MTDKTKITFCIKALTCFVFAIALVLSAPSASHAASGMHGDEFAVTGNHSHDVDSQNYDEMSAMTQHDMPVIALKTGDEIGSVDEVCNGICVSVEMLDTNTLSVDHTTNEKYLMRHARTNSIISSVFLRPPQFII